MLAHPDTDDPERLLISAKLNAAWWAAHRSLRAVGSPELQRFLNGLRAWMGGGFAWHSTSPRHRTTNTDQE